MITTMLLDFPPLRAGDEVEFVEFLPGDQVGVVAESGKTYAVPASHVSADFVRPTWGGARPGAGRPRLTNEPTVEATISLPASLDAKAQQIGGGNRSAGIRLALEAFGE